MTAATDDLCHWCDAPATSGDHYSLDGNADAGLCSACHASPDGDALEFCSACRRLCDDWYDLEHWREIPALEGDDPVQWWRFPWSPGWERVCVPCAHHRQPTAHLAGAVPTASRATARVLAQLDAWDPPIRFSLDDIAAAATDRPLHGPQLDTLRVLLEDWHDTAAAAVTAAALL
jgi:hypothetical protein